MTSPPADLYRAVVRGLWIAAAVGGVMGIATVRVMASGEREIVQSTAALRAGDARGAAEHARRAAGWYAPAAPHVRVAYDRLLALGAAAEGLGDRDLALFAYRSVRSAVLESRWVVLPNRDALDRANAAIARLAATSPRAVDLRGQPSPALLREHLDALSQEEAPGSTWVVLLVAAAGCWVTGAVSAADSYAQGSRGGRRRAVAGLLAMGFGIAIFCLAVWKA